MSNYRVAIGSLGTIGTTVAKKLDEGIDGLSLVAVSANNRDRAQQKVADFKRPP